jgi:hypothetical protein
MKLFKRGDQDAKPDTPGHIRGVRMGNEPGGYERAAGHLPDGTSSARRSTGINADERDPIDPRMPSLSPP